VGVDPEEAEVATRQNPPGKNKPADVEPEEGKVATSQAMPEETEPADVESEEIAIPGDQADLISGLDRAASDAGSFMARIVCPLCGLFCLANVPPLPSDGYSESDGACQWCRGYFKVVRRSAHRHVEIHRVGVAFPAGSLEGKVAVLWMGTPLQQEIDIKSLIARLKVQDRHKFVKRDPIRSLGDPDLDNDRYTCDKLFGYLPRPAGFDYCIGITAARPETTSFSYVDYAGAKILITLHGTQDVCENTGRSLEDFLLMSIGAGILYIQYLRNLVQYKGVTPDEVARIASSCGGHDRDLYHTEAKACIFNASNNREKLGFALKTCQICDSCRGKLEDHNVPESSLRAVERILANIRKPTFRKSFVSLLQDPVLSFIFGLLVGGLLVELISNFIVTAFPYSEVIFLIAFSALAVLLVVGKYIWDLFKART